MSIATARFDTQRLKTKPARPVAIHGLAPWFTIEANCSALVRQLGGSSCHILAMATEYRGTSNA
jgi:hypothetical protein